MSEPIKLKIPGLKAVEDKFHVSIQKVTVVSRS